jgi:hypothetical protein
MGSVCCTNGEILNACIRIAICKPEGNKDHSGSTDIPADGKV